MTEKPVTASVEFFDTQFRRQVEAGEYALNPFERAVLPYLSGELLDLGCGLGNLSLAAAAQGCKVLALDASPAAVEDLARRARASGLAVEARSADLRNYASTGEYDSIVSIGLAMFFACPDARALLANARDAVKPGGVAAINVLIEGTSFLGMFAPADYCLFGEHELVSIFAGWKVLHLAHDAFPAPGDTLKRFCTLVAEKPRAGG